jgi:hypothetical protein
MNLLKDLINGGEYKYCEDPVEFVVNTSSSNCEPLPEGVTEYTTLLT